MHIHILGICGTFMGGVALLARQMGMQVSGCDSGVYPPMSTQLEAAGIDLIEGFDPAQLQVEPDLIVIGNAMSRGNPLVEAVLDKGLRYTSGPQFVADHILPQRWVLGVAGTHGKTTTSSMLSWILEYAGLKPGFLVGGVPENFGVSARLGETPFFVIEADEYDTAFFDKRSKFVHYHPRTVILNNLEYDHADIFPDLEAIQRQFHHLVRTIPGSGLIVYPEEDENLQQVLQMGCWTQTETSSLQDKANEKKRWWHKKEKPDGSEFLVFLGEELQGCVKWDLIGDHNVANALCAIAAARHAGVPVKQAIEALATFKNVKRRMELRGEVNGVNVYDDFAHHPTAIKSTLMGLRKKVGREPIIAVLEPRSNTMRMGIHQSQLAASLADADQVLLFQPSEINWNLQEIASEIGEKAHIFQEVEKIISYIKSNAEKPANILIMSNGGFENIHNRLLERLQDA